MTGLLFVIHAITAILLITVILMQSGRGGGLTDSFASAESMFGAKTNQFMVRTTVVLASLFLVTSLTLAHLSSKQGRSLMPEVSQQQVIPIDLGAGVAGQDLPAVSVDLGAKGENPPAKTDVPSAAPKAAAAPAAAPVPAPATLPNP